MRPVLLLFFEQPLSFSFPQQTGASARMRLICVRLYFSLSLR